MLHFAVEAAFDDLLCRWRNHNDILNRRGATWREKAEARVELDKARDRMHKLRVAMYPEEDERDSIIDSVWCETLEMVMRVRWMDRDDMRPGNFRCACGHLIPIDWSVARTPS